MRPGSVEVADAIAMVQQARLAVEVDRLRQLALDYEQHERWQEARAAYLAALGRDPGIQFAQDGASRCEEIITLVQYARSFIDEPDRLLKSRGRDNAAQVIKGLLPFQDAGPKIHQLHDDLARLLRLATTPVRVTLQSDENTSVDVLKVGQYGAFTSMTLELLPGVYTVVGRRAGYKDIRLTLRLSPGDTEATWSAICTEAL